MIRVLAILGCWVISFLFAGIEAAVLAVDPIRLRSHVKRKQRGAQRLNRLLKRPERLLVTVLLVTSLADILALLLLTHGLVTRIGYAGFLVSLVIAVPVYVFVLGVLPKSLFRRFPFRGLAPLAGLLQIVSTILWPLLEIGACLGRFFSPRQPGEGARLFAAREELKQITIQSEHEGSLTSAERAMIHNVVDFTTVKVRHVMIPLARALTVPPEIPVEQLLQLSAAQNVDRLPVVSNDRAIGLVNVMDILLDQEERGPLQRYIRRLLTAAEEEPAYRVIQRLRAARRGLAAVLDKEQSFSGIVAVEELIKRLVSTAPAQTGPKN